MIRTRARSYDPRKMSKRYRDNPLTDIPGPFVPGKGQSYFRVEFLANTKAHNYVLSRLRILFENMPASAKSRKNADGTPGRCLATLEEIVNKAATQKLICPTTKVGIFNEVRFRRGRAPRDPVPFHRPATATPPGRTRSRRRPSAPTTASPTTPSTRTS